MSPGRFFLALLVGAGIGNGAAYLLDRFQAVPFWARQHDIPDDPDDNSDPWTEEKRDG